MKNIKNIILLCFIGFFIIFLFDRIKPATGYSILENLEIPSYILAQSDVMRKEVFFNSVVNEIESVKRLETKYIGIAGRRSNQPDYFEKLGNCADTNQLVKLTDHRSPLVRSIAFTVLQNKNYSGLKQIFKKHLKDNQTYDVYAGCTISPNAVNIDFYYCISSSLNLQEKKLYKTELMKQYKNTWFEYMIGEPSMAITDQ